MTVLSGRVSLCHARKAAQHSLLCSGKWMSLQIATIEEDFGWLDMDLQATGFLQVWQASAC